MLKQIRLDSGKTLNQVSSDLKIRKKYLVALEEGDFDILPGEVYVRGYLKLYLDYLNVKDRNAEQIEATKQNETEKLLNNKRATALINYKRKKQLVVISIIMLSIIIVSHPFIINAQTKMDNKMLDRLHDEANKEEFEGDKESTAPQRTKKYLRKSISSTYKLPLEASYVSGLKKLMKEVEYKLDDLLSMLVNNQNENKELKDNYIKMLDQINIYINELEEIKKQQK